MSVFSVPLGKLVMKVGIIGRWDLPPELWDSPFSIDSMYLDVSFFSKGASISKPFIILWTYSLAAEVDILLKVVWCMVIRC